MTHTSQNLIGDIYIVCTVYIYYNIMRISRVLLLEESSRLPVCAWWLCSVPLQMANTDSSATSI